eukprot:2069703-Rhodomonas_salina.1
MAGPRGCAWRQHKQAQHRLGRGDRLGSADEGGEAPVVLHVHPGRAPQQLRHAHLAPPCAISGPRFA